MEPAAHVSFVENPLIIHVKGDPETMMSVLFAVSGERALVSSEGTLGWVGLDRFTVESDTLSLDIRPQPAIEPAADR